MKEKLNRYLEVNGGNMKKIIISDFSEYNDPHNKLGNYHYANCFAKNGYEVLWLSNPFNELIYLKDKEDYKFKKSISSITRHKLSRNIYGFAPYTRKLYGNYPFFKDKERVLNGEKYIRPSIEETMKKIKFDEVDLLWISNPKNYWLVNVIKYEKLIFRIPDDFLHMRAWPSSIKDIESELIDKADVIFVTSANLEDKVKKRGKSAYGLKNGVDFNFFNKEVEMPKEYIGSENRIVYVGAIKEWFDKDLLKVAAAKLQNSNFFIIGKPQIDISDIEEYPNVYFLGPRDYKEIPRYLKCADVGIIPFKVNELTNAVNPLKLYEYCASGLQVVSTNLEEVKNINAPIYISNNTDEFCENIKTAMANDWKEEIIKFAKDNSWEARFETLKEALYANIY